MYDIYIIYLYPKFNYVHIIYKRIYINLLCYIYIQFCLAYMYVEKMNRNRGRDILQ